MLATECLLTLDDYKASRQSQTLYDCGLQTDEVHTTEVEVTTERELLFIDGLNNDEVRNLLRVKDGSNTETSMVERCEEELPTWNHPSESIVEEKIVVLDESDDTHELVQAAEQMRKEQMADEELMECWSKREKGEDGFYIRAVDKLLFHKDNMGREVVQQMVVAKTKVREILELAHDCVWGGHFGSRKTSQRIKFSFFWPGINKEIKTYCQSCIACQIRRRKTVKDRVPITPVIRPANAF